MVCLGFGKQRVNYTVTGNRIDGHSLLHQTKEKLASTLGSPTIESERELVEIVAQMFMTDGPLVRSHQPSFEQGDYAVDARHQLGCGLLLPLKKRDLVLVAVTLQGRVSQPAWRTLPGATDACTKGMRLSAEASTI